jgi:hypothetical protein
LEDDISFMNNTNNISNLHQVYYIHYLSQCQEIMSNITF